MQSLEASVYEALREVGALLGSAGLLTLVTRLWGVHARAYITGVVAAFLVLGLLFLWHKLSFVLPEVVPPRTTFARLLSPLLEEATRTWCVFVLLRTTEGGWRTALAFALGYAGVETLYEFLWIASAVLLQIEGSYSVADLPAPMLSSLTLLGFLGILMFLLREMKVGAAPAFAVCFLLHMAHNVAVTLDPAREPTPSDLWPLWLAVSGASAASLILLARRQASSSP